MDVLTPKQIEISKFIKSKKLDILIDVDKFEDLLNAFDEYAEIQIEKLKINEK